MSEPEGTDPTTPKRWEFNPEQLDRTVLAIPLLNDLNAERDGEEPAELHSVVMEINLEHPEPRDETRKIARRLVEDAIEHGSRANEPEEVKDRESPQYLYARLWGDTIREVVERNEELDRPIYRIWPDFEIGAL